MHSFFVEPCNLSGDMATLTGAEAKHIYKVLRLLPGQAVKLFDGTGMVYTAETCEVTKDYTKTTIIKSKQCVSRPPHLHIGQAVIKKKPMDMVIQKITELGVDSLHPFVSQHCSLTYRPSTQEERWKKISQEACKQCKRPTPPIIKHVTDFNTLIANGNKYDLKIILWEEEQEASLQSFNHATIPNSVLLLIGPEGGFTSPEISKARSAGFTTVTLGQRVLRTETASIAAASIIQYLLGNLNRDHKD